MADDGSIFYRTDKIKKYFKKILMVFWRLAFDFPDHGRFNSWRTEYDEKPKHHHSIGYHHGTGCKKFEKMVVGVNGSGYDLFWFNLLY